MTRLAFEYWHEGETHWARWNSAGDAPVHEHWWGLWDSRALDSIDNAHYAQFAVNGNNSEEVAVYLRVVWTLLREHMVIGSARHHSGNLSPQLQHPQSSTTWAFGAPQTNAVRVSTFQELSALTRSVLRGDWSEINLIGTNDAQVGGVARLLATSTAPTTAEILQGTTLFVALGIGVNTGYNDCILVASARELESVLIPIAHAANDGIAQYEAQLTDDTTPAEFLVLLRALAGQRT